MQLRRVTGWRAASGSGVKDSPDSIRSDAIARSLSVGLLTSHRPRSVQKSSSAFTAGFLAAFGSRNSSVFRPCSCRARTTGSASNRGTPTKVAASMTVPMATVGSARSILMIVGCDTPTRRASSSIDQRRRSRYVFTETPNSRNVSWVSGETLGVTVLKDSLAQAAFAHIEISRRNSRSSR